MVERRPRPAWMGTGHYNLVTGLIGLVLFGLPLVVAIAHGAVGAIVIFGLFTLGNLLALTQGVRQLRARRAD